MSEPSASCYYIVKYDEESAEWVGTCPQYPSLSWLDEDKYKAFAGIVKLVAELEVLEKKYLRRSTSQ